jgi:hypothetical protein
MADDRISVQVSLDDHLSVPAERVKKKIDDIGDKAEKSAAQLALFDHELNTTGDSAAESALQLGLFSEQEVKAGDASAKSARKQKAANDERERSARVNDKSSHSMRRWLNDIKDTHGWLGRLDNMFSRFDNHIHRSTNDKKGGMFGMMHFGIRFGAIFSFIKFGAIADGITAIGSAAFALGGAAIGLVAAWTPVLGVVGALPALAMAGMSSLKLLTGALAEMQPQLEAFSSTINKKAVSIIKPALAKDLAAFKQPITNFQTSTAQGLKPSLVQIGQYGKSAGFRQQFADITASNKVNVGNIGSSAVSSLKALVDIMHAAIPMTEMLGSKFAGMMQRISVWTGSHSDVMQKFFAKSGEVTMNTLHSLSDYSKGIFEIGKLSVGLGGEMGRSIQSGGEKFLAWTKSVKGQNSIKKFFEDIRPPLHEFWLLLVAVTKAFTGLSTSEKGMDSLSRTFRALRTELLPFLEQLSSQSQGTFLPNLAKAAGALANIFTNMHMGLMMEFIAKSLSGLATFIAALPKPVQTFLSMIATVASLVKIVGFSLGGWVKPIRKAAAEMLIYIARATTAAVVSKFGGTPAPVPVPDSVKPFVKGGSMSPVVTGVGKFLTNPVTLAVGAVIAGGAIGHQAARDKEEGKVTTATKLGDVSSTLGGGMGGFMHLNKLYDDYRNKGFKPAMQNYREDTKGYALGIPAKAGQTFAGMLKQLSGVFKTVSSAASAVMGPIRSVANTIKSAFGHVAGSISTALRPVTRVVQSVFHLVATIFRSVAKVITAAVQAAGRIVSKNFNAIKTTIQHVLNRAREIVSNIFQTIKEKIQGPLQTVKGWISSAWNAVKDTLKGPLQNVKGWVSGTWNGITSSITGPLKSASDTITTIIDGVANAISGAASAIATFLSKIARREGGPVTTGLTYTVGEAGQEMYVDKDGGTALVGKYGQEQRSFAKDGFIIPNHLLITRNGKDSDSPSSSSVRKSGLVSVGSGNPTVNIGTINTSDPREVVQSVKMGIIAAERDKRERSFPRPGMG